MPQNVASFEGACNWHADCRNVHQSCCLWIECSFLYHKPSPKAFQRIWQYIWQYIQPTSQPQTTCNTPAQDLHIQHLHLQDRLRPATRTAAATIGLHNQRISAQTVSPHRGLDLTAVHRCNRLGQMLTFDGVWHFGEVFSSWMNPGFHCTGQMADSVYRVGYRTRYF